VSVSCLAFYITQGADLGFASVSRRRRRPRSPGRLPSRECPRCRDGDRRARVQASVHAGLGYDSVSAGLALLAYTLPTLVMPRFAERLALRYQPNIVIPAGLVTIGAGFILMKLGSAAAQPSWLTMLRAA